MDTYTITEAARLVGTSKAKLYQAIRAGRLQALAGQEPGAVRRVTPVALRAAGFALPPAPSEAPTPASPAPAPAAEAAPAPATPEVAAPEVPALPPTRPGPDQALIAHLERALEQAQARELRLLDLLADLTRQRSAPQAPPAPGAPLPAAAARPPARPPLSGLRQQIVAVVRQHPEGIAPRDVRTLLAVDHDVRSTMKGLVRSGILTRREAGRYVVAPEGAEP
jgi:excisionase family DNA binding protein